MKIAQILLLIFSLSLPVAGTAYPRNYYYSKPTITYCNFKHCQCHYCKPSSNYYYCDYCYDAYEGCPECDRDMGKIFLISTIIVAAAYLVDRVINS